MDTDEQYTEALTAAISIIREHRSLQLASASMEVTRDKLINLDVRLWKWDKTQRPHKRDTNWDTLIDNAINLITREHKRMAWHLKTVDLSIYGKHADTAYHHLYAQAKASQHLGAHSIVSLSVVAALVGTNKMTAGRWRRRFLDDGILTGDIGRPWTHPDGPAPGVINFPTPEDTPYGFHPEKILSPLTDEEVTTIQQAMYAGKAAALESRHTLSDKQTWKRDRARSEATRLVSTPLTIITRTNHPEQEELSGVLLGLVGSNTSGTGTDPDPEVLTSVTEEGRKKRVRRTGPSTATPARIPIEQWQSEYQEGLAHHMAAWRSTRTPEQLARQAYADTLPLGHEKVTDVDGKIEWKSQTGIEPEEVSGQGVVGRSPCSPFIEHRQTSEMPTA